jgi:di/tricarboxylate transporter
MTDQPIKPIGRRLAIIGTVLQLAPFIGLGGTVIGMAKAFSAMGSSGIGDPSGLAKAIGEVLVAAAAGLVVGLLGAILLALGVLVFNYRKRWAVILLTIIGIMWVIGIGGMAVAAILAPKSASGSTSCLTPGLHHATIVRGYSFSSAAACSAC